MLSGSPQERCSPGCRNEHFSGFGLTAWHLCVTSASFITPSVLHRIRLAGRVEIKLAHPAVETTILKWGLSQSIDTKTWCSVFCILCSNAIYISGIRSFKEYCININASEQEIVFMSDTVAYLSHNAKCLPIVWLEIPVCYASAASLDQKWGLGFRDRLSSLLHILIFYFLIYYNLKSLAPTTSDSSDTEDSLVMILDDTWSLIQYVETYRYLVQFRALRAWNVWLFI